MENFALRGKFGALSFKRKLLEEVVVGGSLVFVVSDFSKLGLHLNVQRVICPDANSFYELPEFRGRILLLLLLQCCTKLDHTIGVDTRWNSILNSSERYPLVLSSKSLLLCAGGDPIKSGIEKVRELAKI